MELIDIPLQYLLTAFVAWMVSFIWFAKHPEWIGAAVLIVFFFMRVILDSLLGGAYIPVGQAILVFFGPPLLVSLSVKRIRIVWTDLIILGAYCFCIVVSIILNDLSLWGRKAALIPMLLVLLIYFSIGSQKAFYRILTVFIALVALNSVIAGLQVAGFDWAYPSGHGHRAEAGGYRRGFGLAGNFTMASMYAAITIPVAAAMFVRSRGLNMTVLSFGFGVVGVAAQLFSVSRSAVLGVAMGLWVVLKRGCDLRTLVAGMVAMALAGTIIVLHPITARSGGSLVSHLSVFVTEEPLDQSAANRPDLFRNGLATWSENPVFGGGPFAVHRAHGKDPHNTLINVGAQFGVVGLMCFLLFLYRCYQHTLRAARMGYRVEGAALGGALVSTLPIAFFHSLDYIELFWFVPALCLALGRFPPLQKAVEKVPTSIESRTLQPSFR